MTQTPTPSPSETLSVDQIGEYLSQLANQGLPDVAGRADEVLAIADEACTWSAAGGELAGFLQEASSTGVDPKELVIMYNVAQNTVCKS